MLFRALLLAILLTVSGWARTVPEVVGLSHQQAEEKLRGEGFSWKVLYTPGERDGQVVRQLPEAGSEASPEGPTLILYVSTAQVTTTRTGRAGPRWALLIVLQLLILVGAVHLMRRWRSQKGASLLEALMALALVGSVLSVFILLFHNGLRIGTRVEQVAAATLLAENTLADLHDWASRPANWEAGFLSFTGTPLVDPDFPGYSITVQAAPVDTFSPCTSFERPLIGLPGGPRNLARSLVLVQVEVAWSPRRGDSVRLVSQLGEPARAPDDLAIKVERTGGPPDPVGPDQAVTFKASLTDGGDPISDVFFTWSVEPLASPTSPPGNGTLEPQGRDGRMVALRNRYLWNPNLPEDDPGYWRQVPGRVGVVALTRYHGRNLPPSGSVPGTVVELGP